MFKPLGRDIYRIGSRNVGLGPEHLGKRKRLMGRFFCVDLTKRGPFLPFIDKYIDGQGFSYVLDPFSDHVTGFSPGRWCSRIPSSLV